MEEGIHKISTPGLYFPQDHILRIFNALESIEKPNRHSSAPCGAHLDPEKISAQRHPLRAPQQSSAHHLFATFLKGTIQVSA